MSLFISKTCSVSVITTSNMDEKRLDGQTKSMDDVGISARLLAKQCDIRSLCVSTERSLHDLNDTL